MTPQQELKCLIIIQNAAGAAGLVGAGLAQLPTLDKTPLTSVLATMARSLGDVFDRPLLEADAQKLAANLLATRPLRPASQWAVGWVPVFGNALNGATASGLASGLGWSLVRALDRGESLVAE
jgi:uncharacterized protein (DUF697 family)